MPFAFLVASLFSFQLPAQPPPAPQQPPLPAITDLVVVTASLVELPLSRVTDSVTLVTRAELRDRQVATVADALRSVAGLNVAASGGAGAVTSIFTRGGESDYTLVMIDGVPINEFGGSITLGHLSTANVDRVEIVRGPQSALFGAGAIAGVVNIVTADTDRAGGAALIEAGSRDLRRAAIDGHGATAGWRVSGGIDALRTDGFTGSAPNGALVSNDDYERTELSAAASRAFARSSRARIAARWNDNDRGFPGPYGSDPGGTFSGIDTVARGRNQSAAVSGGADIFTGRVAHRVTGAWMRLESDFESAFGPSSSATRRGGARYVADLPFGSAGLSAGAEISAESGRSTFIVNRAGSEIPIERTIAGVFAEGRFAAGSRLLLTAGARLDGIRRQALEGDSNPFGARPDMPADTIWSLNPRLSALLTLTPASAANATRLRASFATGIKPPSAFELASTDNPSLAPERNVSAQAGIEQILAGGALQMSALAFWNRYDDLIITVGQSIAGASQYRSANLSNARASGIEIAMDARGTGRLHGLTVRGGYTWLRTEILAADGAGVTGLAPFTVGDRLLRRPRHRAFADVSIARGPVTAFASLDARGRTLDIDPSFGLFGGLYENTGFATASAGASVRVHRLVSVFARVTNLADRAYEEILGFPAPGRQLFGGVRVAAGR